MPLLLLWPPAFPTATAAAAAPAPAPVAFSRLRCSHLPFAFPRLRKYGRRHREPVAAPTSDDDEEEEDGDYDEDEEGMEMEVDEEEFLATRPKPAGFGEGKTYSADIEEQLLREMGLGGARRGGDAASAKRREGNSPGKVTGTGWFPALLPPNCFLFLRLKGILGRCTLPIHLTRECMPLICIILAQIVLTWTRCEYKCVVNNNRTNFSFKAGGTELLIHWKEMTSYAFNNHFLVTKVPLN